MLILHLKAAFLSLISFQIKLATDLKKLNNNLASSSNWSSFYKDAFHGRPWVWPHTMDFLFVCSKFVFPVASKQTSFPQVSGKNSVPMSFLVQWSEEPNLWQAHCHSLSVWDFTTEGFIVFHKLVSGYSLFFSFGNLTLKGLSRRPLLSPLI